MRCVILVALLGLAAAKDLFTSSADVARLFRAQPGFKRELTKYAEASLAIAENLKRVLDGWEDVSSIKESEITPRATFKLIRRVVEASKLIDKLHASNREAQVYVDELQTSGRFPDETDLIGATQAILRLQRTYKLSVSELLGLDADFNDLFTIGLEAYHQQDYKTAISWLDLASSTAITTTERFNALDHVSFAAYKQGDVANALHYAQQAYLSDPRPRLSNNIAAYTKMITEGTLVAVSSSSFDSDREKSATADNILNHSEEEMSSFRQLCRQPSSFDATCSYAPPLSPYPQPVEMLAPHTSANVRVFRNFMSSEECDAIIQIAAPQMARSKAYNGTQLTTTEYRISEVTWLSSSDNVLIHEIDRRIAMVTGLNITTAEPLQVSNYGVGGHYEPHFDYGTASHFVEDGNRLATLMVYLSDVQAGGATAFPRLHVAIPPKKGDAAFWFNLRPDGVGDIDTLHGGCPVVEGSKWVANKWFHERGNDCRL